jgi:lipopolysaccharide transport system ATP-binding protein
MNRTMGNIAICAENVSKKYYIGRRLQKSQTLLMTVADSLISPFRKAGKLLRGQATGASELDEPIWALQNVSFEVKKGEVVGIIGRNGSGKSTLLKIFSRITELTEGCVDIHGRASALLEVGTGFHPELTGRENIYLNGAILGMKRNEIDRKFDEIVAFSEIDKFIDTPVKHYSSGMYVRLGFGVAAHLEPDIMIVDEVLAVGDAQFQRKCLEKMDRTSKEGRTVLFVSHNMGAITRLCNRVLWLDDGQLKMDGPSMDVATKFSASGAQDTSCWESDPSGDYTGRLAWLKHARMLSKNGDDTSALVHYDEQVRIELSYEIAKPVNTFRSYLLLRDAIGNFIWASHDTDGTPMMHEERKPGVYLSTCVFPERLLRPGRYFVTVGIFGKPRAAVEEEYVDIISFQISEVGYSFNHEPRKGLLTPYLSWSIERS